MMGLFDKLSPRRNLEMRAVYKEDIEQFLESLEVLEDLEQGRINCEICGQQITLDNIGAISSKENSIRIRCDDYTCLRGDGP